MDYHTCISNIYKFDASEIFEERLLRKQTPLVIQSPHVFWCKFYTIIYLPTKAAREAMMILWSRDMLALE